MSEGARGAPAKRLWDRVEREIRHRGWTKIELSQRTGLGRATIDGLSKGRKPLARTVNKLAEVLGIPLDEAHRLAGLYDDGAEPALSEAEDAELRELLAKLPPARRAILERVRREERERYRRMREEARAEYERSQERLLQIVRTDLEAVDDTDSDSD